MKKISFFVFVLFVCCIVFAGFRSLSVSAQSDVGNTDEYNFEQKNIRNDLELAATIRQLTNRSPEILNERRISGGGFSIDTQSGFQNVMLSRLEADGETTDACVTSLDEANAFFGINLETGEFVPRTAFQKEDIAAIAARHGMSVKEFLFYKNMIAQDEMQKLLSPESVTINIVNVDGAGEGFNETTAKTSEGGNSGSIGAQRLNVFNEAATIWGNFLDSNVPISVRAQFDPLFCDATSAVLGSAGATGSTRDFPGALIAGTWYSYALANKMRRSDLNGTAAGQEEINATFNSNVNGDAGCLGGKRFYLGLDNATPAGTTNLLVVVLHEIGHGLGFASLVNSSTGALASGFPDAYLRNMYDKTSGLSWVNMTDAQRQASAVNTHNVVWDGASIKTASSSFLTAGLDSAGRVQLYTPNPIQNGSSVSHWDTDATTNLLMEPSINTGLPIDLDLTRQQMRDIGWFRDTNTADTTKDAITTVQPTGTVRPNSSTTVTWSNVGGFSKNVKVELSTDNGANYTTLDANKVNTGSITFTAPNVTTTQAFIRVTEVNFAEPSGISNSFSILAPTAATVSVSGKVVNSFGRGISNASVTVTGNSGATIYGRTNAFGYFAFSEIAAGETYIFRVNHKQFTFAPQVLNITEDVTEMNFVAQP